MGPDTRRANLLRTGAELTGTEKVLLQLEHGAEAPSASSPGEMDAPSELDHERVMQLAEWTYHHVEEVWSGFNLVAEAVAKSFDVTTRFKKDQGRVDAWNRRVHIEDKVWIWILVGNHLRYHEPPRRERHDGRRS